VIIGNPVYITIPKEGIEMSKFNIGHISGITVNTTENLINKVKEDVPAAKDATKGKFHSWKDSVKAEYKKVREGEVEPRMQESVATKAIELTTGGK
jgi:hypothetical protein